MFSLQMQKLETMTALWLLPVIPTVTTASCAISSLLP